MGLLQKLIVAQPVKELSDIFWKPYVRNLSLSHDKDDRVYNFLLFFWIIHFNIILKSVHGSSKWAPCCNISNQNPMRISAMLRCAFNPLAPNEIYICRTPQRTSRRCILNIYSTNILTEYFKARCTFYVFFLFKMPFIS